MIKKLWKKWGPNPLDRALKKGIKKILIPWNRGLGDIALGLYAIVHRIKSYIPDAEITFITRPDLEEGFALLEGVNVRIDPSMERHKPYQLTGDLSEFDLVLDKADPSHWVAWQRGTLVPKLRWNSAWDVLCERFSLPSDCIAAHVQCETGYYGARDWPAERWHALFASTDRPFVLLGRKKDPVFSYPHVIDLRGETTLFEMLSIIKNRCSTLIAPDSGVLSMAYYLDAAFPLRILSLWADPHHGVLKQNVASPNPELHHIPLISPDRKNAALIPVEIVRKILSYPAGLLDEQRKRLASPPAIPMIAPLTGFTRADDQASGDLRALGTVILAGGQGTRLETSRTKGLIPITPIKGKSLLQLFCEKTAAASRKCGHPLPLAIMTSPLNHEEIRSFLESHSNFGLSIDLFTQDMLPFLDDKGNWIIDEAGKIAEGPDGNGHCWKNFVASGIWDKWRERGISHVSVLPIDNPLADPFDVRLLGPHVGQGNDVTLKAIFREDPQEKVGAICLRNGKVGVWEYSEMHGETKNLQLANINRFCLTMPFIKTLSQKRFPWHLARKKYINSFIWKFETFMFDMLEYSEKTGVVVFPREQIYSPLKNATGDKSLQTVQASLIARDRAIIAELTGKTPPSRPFELSQDFYYPTPQLAEIWKGKEIPSRDYIDEAYI